MKLSIQKTLTWLVVAILAAILAAACQPAPTNETSVTVDTALPINTQPKPTLPHPNPTATLIEPTETSQPATHTPPATSEPTIGLPVCDVLPENELSPVTPSPQAGISVAMDSSFPPAPPAKVEAVSSSSNVLLTWGGTGTDVDQFYKVYQRMDGDPCWQLIGIKMIEGDNKGEYEFDVLITALSDKYVFAITTVDIYGNESDLSIAENNGSG